LGIRYGRQQGVGDEGRGQKTTEIRHKRTGGTLADIGVGASGSGRQCLASGTKEPSPRRAKTCNADGALGASVRFRWKPETASAGRP
jgi:hypothetical protein